MKPKSNDKKRQKESKLQHNYMHNTTGQEKSLAITENKNDIVHVITIGRVLNA